MDAEDLLLAVSATARRLGPGVRPRAAAELLDALTRTARVLFGASACSLALLTDDESELVYTAADGAGADAVVGLRIPSGQGVAGWVAASGQPVAIGDLARDPRFAGEVAEQTGYVPRAMLVVPVRSPDRLLGVLTVLDRDTSRPDAERDMERLALFADQAALAVEAVRAFDDVGGLLLQALAAAADERAPGLAGLIASLPEPGPGAAELAETAEVLAALGDAGPVERRLAVRLLREVLRYTRERYE